MANTEYRRRAVLQQFSEQGISCCRCGNVAAILELDEHLNKSFMVNTRPSISFFLCIEGNVPLYSVCFGLLACLQKANI